MIPDITQEAENLRETLGCPCGCNQNFTSIEFATLLLFAQGVYGKEFTITSGYRCPNKNKAEKGLEDSASLYGEHADIAYWKTVDAFLIIKALIGAGFERLRVYPLDQAFRIGKKTAHIHVDRHPKYQEPTFTVGLYPEKR